MKITITGKNLELTEAIKAAAEEKLGKLEKYFKPETEAYVTVSVQKNLQKAEVTIPTKKHVVRAEQESEDLYVSLELAADAIERQLKKYRTKLASKHLNEAGSFKQEYLYGKDEEPEDEVRIVRTKTVEMKPMFPEDACIQMDLLGHDFYVFRNAETDEINVVYKRKGNTYGLIEPEN